MKKFMIAIGLFAVIASFGVVSPAMADSIDLTTESASFTDDADVTFMQWATDEPAGTGYSDGFVQWRDDRDSGAPDGNLWGSSVNSSDRVLDTYNSPRDSSLDFTAYTPISYDGDPHVGFGLDINEPASGILPGLSVDEIRIFVGLADRTWVQLTDSVDAAEIYTFSADSGKERILLDYDVNGLGQGRADMLMLVPLNLFDVGEDTWDYVYVYTQTGAYTDTTVLDFGDNGNYEEWALAAFEDDGWIDPFSVPVPEPASLILFGAGAVGAFVIRRRRRRT